MERTAECEKCGAAFSGPSAISSYLREDERGRLFCRDGRCTAAENGVEFVDIMGGLRRLASYRASWAEVSGQSYVALVAMDLAESRDGRYRLTLAGVRYLQHFDICQHYSAEVLASIKADLVAGADDDETCSVLRRCQRLLTMPLQELLGWQEPEMSEPLGVAIDGRIDWLDDLRRDLTQLLEEE